jgi:hypothetical protein
MPLSERLIALEREGWEALAAGDGATYYRKHLTANALFAFPFGVLTREEAIDAIEAASPWAHFGISNPRVVELGHDIGVVVYTVVAQRADQAPYSAVISSTFVRDGDQWKLAFHQQSPAN